MVLPPPLSEPKPKFRVAICGAGIGGLILAITIGKYDPSIPIDLYEAHDSIDTAGVGITLWRQTHDTLVNLGLFDEFKQIFTFDPDRKYGPKVRRSDIHEGGYEWYHRVRLNGPSSMHRQHMIAILERHLPISCTVYPKKRLVNYVEPDPPTSPIRLEFADGTTATTDVLIGADGVRSAVRKTMFEVASQDGGNEETDLKQYIDATFTGISMYRCLIPAESLGKESPEHASLKNMTIFIGKGRYLTSYPVAKGALVNVVAMVCDPALMDTHYEGRWVSDATRDDVVGSFDDFEPDAMALLKHCDKPLKWAMHVVKPLPFCVRKKVALIGDACHAMTPHFAGGAVQAIDDAFVLGRLLAHPLTSLSRVQDALRIYEQVRFPFARQVGILSLSTAWMFAFFEPGYYDGTRGEDDVDDRGVGAHEREGMETLKREIFRRWDIIDGSRSAPQVWEEAESKWRASAGGHTIVTSCERSA